MFHQYLLETLVFLTRMLQNMPSGGANSPSSSVPAGNPGICDQTVTGYTIRRCQLTTRIQGLVYLLFLKRCPSFRTCYLYLIIVPLGFVGIYLYDIHNFLDTDVYINELGKAYIKIRQNFMYLCWGYMFNSSYVSETFLITWRLMFFI